MKQAPGTPAEILVSSLYGARAGQPLVQIEFGSEMAQITPANARDLAMNLLRAAEASETDAFFVEVLCPMSGADDDMIAQILHLHRSWRAKRDAEEDREGR